jgi:hypothetical protein
MKVVPFDSRDRFERWVLVLGFIGYVLVRFSP